MRAFIGAATTSGQGSSADGITIAAVDGARLSPLSTGARGVENPMFLALSPDGHVVYTVHEAAGGHVSAWTVDGDHLAPLGSARSTGGHGPCHLSLHPGGRYLLTADYASGSVTTHPVEADGSLGDRTDIKEHSGAGPRTARQAGPHAHMAVTDAAGGRGHVLVTDLGTDTLHRYELDEATGRLDEADRIDLPAGSGPRHLVVSGDLAYVVGELDSTVTVVDLTSGSPVTSVPTYDGEPQAASEPSAIRLAPDARFLYVANRGVDEIAVLSVNGESLRLVGATPSGGAHPRDIALDPAGEHLFAANQFSDEITSFRIDPESGIPEATGDTLRTPSPACIVFG